MLWGARAMRGPGANDSRELSMEGMFRSEPLVAAVTVWERRACAVIVNEDAHTPCRVSHVDPTYLSIGDVLRETASTESSERRVWCMRYMRYYRGNEEYIYPRRGQSGHRRTVVLCYAQTSLTVQRGPV